MRLYYFLNANKENLNQNKYYFVQKNFDLNMQFQKMNLKNQLIQMVEIDFQQRNLIRQKIICTK